MAKIIEVSNKEELQQNKEVYLSQGFMLRSISDKVVFLEKAPKKQTMLTILIGLFVCLPVGIYFIIANSTAKAEELTIKITDPK